jgi:serine/threonine-protein kinase
MSQDDFDDSVDETRTAVHSVGASSYGLSTGTRLSSTLLDEGGAGPVETLLAGRYRIVSLLGAGGMGAVYRAHDLELDEDVALKLLQPGPLASEAALDRFRLEVKLARKVTHRNVARTYDIGEHQSQRFLTMEFVDGESLGARLRREGPPPLDVVRRIVDDVALGLGAAHAVGVIHRDLKPDNILAAKDGRYVITDFGIAAAQAEELACSDGGLIGTPHYMAPEQVEGHPRLDGRSDLYSLGALLYHLLAGRPPFRGRSAEEIARARLERPAPSLLDKRPSLGEPLALLVARALERAPERRFATVEEFREAVLAALLEAETRVLGLSLAGAHPLGGPPAPTTSSVGSTTSSGLPRSSDHTVAVIPFRFIGPADSAFLAEGLTEDLNDTLSMTRGLRMTARATATRCAAREPDPLVVGSVLGVSAVVEGSVRKVGESVRVSARVLSVRDGLQIWAERFDCAAREMLVISDQVARAVAAALTIERNSPDRAIAASAEVVELYLRAKAEYRQERIETSERAIVLFEQALALQPDDPQLLAAAALAHDRASFIQNIRPGDHGPRSVELATRAIAIASDHPEALLALGVVAQRAGDLRDAARSLRLCVELAPGLHEAQAALGRLLLEVHDPESAAQRLEAARALDPDTRSASRDLARAYAFLGRWDDTDRMLAHTLSVEGPGIPYDFLIARFASWRRDPEAAERAIATAEAAGHREDRVALIRLAATAAQRSTSSPEDIALGQRALHATRSAVTAYRRLFAQTVTEAMAGTGALNAAISALQYAVSLGLYDRVWLDHCPLLRALHGRPDFAALREVVLNRAAEALRGLDDRRR